jgi:hypothetical protein
MKARRENSVTLLYQLRGDLLLKIAMIFMLQASTVARMARLQGAPTHVKAEKPALKVFVEPGGVCRVGTPTGTTNLAEQLRLLPSTNDALTIALYVDRTQGVRSGDYFVQPLLLIRELLPNAKPTLATYEPAP